MVDNMERLIENLCTIWIGRFHLHANPVRFQREYIASFVQPSKVKINSGPVKNSFASVLKSNDHKGSPSSDSSPAIVMDDSCIVDNDLSCSLMGKIKDINALSNIYVIFADEGFDNVNISYLGGFWILIKACSVASKDKMLNHEGLASWFLELCIADPSFVSEDRLVWISIEGLPFNTWNNNAYAKIISQWGTLSEVDTTLDSSSSAKKICVVTKVHTIINQRIKIIVKGKIYWICVKELEAWAPEFNNEFCENSSSDEESMEDGEFNSQKVDDIDHISESSCMKEGNEQQAPKTGTKSEDPFGIYSILKRNNQKEKSKDAEKSDPSFPPGFTPKGVNETIEEEENVSVNKSNSNHHCNKKTGSNGKCGSNRSFKLKAGGSILDVMEDLIEIGHAMGYNMEGCLGHTSKKDWIRELNLKYKVNFATIQETKSEKIDLFAIKSLWGNFNFDFVYSPSVGLSGGILCVWNPNVFAKESVTVSDSFVAVRGTWISSSLKLMFVSVYAPQDISERKSLWDYIKHMINLWDGECIILGDFNEVRSENERFGTIFNDIGAKAFNHFISSSCLIDLPLEGYSFTWALKSGSKMSKLDRFLISEGLISIFPSLAAICLDRRLSDHRPILLRESSVDYGPTPFCVFHSWFTKDGFDNLIADTWNNLSIMETNKISLLRKKFQALKAIIKSIRIDESLTLSHLFYADDAVFIGKWDKANVITIVNMLKCFYLASGLKINIQKSKIMGIGTSQEEVDVAANVISCNTFSSPFNYLSVKVGSSSSRSNFWDEVIAKLSSRLSKWKIKMLSIGGHFTLNKDVLSSLPIYLMSIYKTPVGVLRKMESIRRRFFNGADINENKMSMIGWEKIMVLRKKEGLAMFGDGGALDNTGKFARSSTWITIVRECGNLSSTEKINASSISCSFRRLPRGSLEEEQFSKLIEDVNSVILSVSNDRWIWSLDSSGEFSIKSTRLFIDDHLLLAVGAPTRWVLEVPIKINIMAWKVSLDKLPTRLNLSLQGIEIPSITCPICTCAGESCSHLFFSCSMARNITTKLARWWEFDCPDLFSYDDWLEWFHTLRLLKGFKDILEGVFYVMWWVIWK
ncbi:RNA-directed DNA polymerase, eukaryota [Tanacetum coccineum]